MSLILENNEHFKLLFNFHVLYLVIILNNLNDENFFIEYSYNIKTFYVNVIVSILVLDIATLLSTGKRKKKIALLSKVREEITKI